MNEGIYQNFQNISNVLRCLDGDFVAIKMSAENEDPYICSTDFSNSRPICSIGGFSFYSRLVI